MNSDCHRFRGRIADFVAGTLARRDSQELQDHLSVCESCRDHMLALRQEDVTLVQYFAGLDKNMTDRQERTLQRIECFDMNERTDTIPIWRKIMRSRYSRFATVAAILVLATVSMVVLDKSTPSAYALEQTVEALQNVRHVHLVERDDTGVIKSERWIEIGQDGAQVRYRQDKPPGLFVIDDGRSIARYHPYAKAVTFRNRNEIRYEWISNIGRAFENARDEGMILEENAAYHGRQVHKVWWPAMRDVCYVDPATKLPIAIGNTDLSYEQPAAGTFDTVIPGGHLDGYTVVTDVNESGFHANVELIQPDEHLAEILNADDVITLHRTGPYTYEGDLDIQVKCSTDIRWGLFMKVLTEPLRGFSSCSCSIDRWEMTKPGGVATVGVKLTGGRIADTPRDCNIGTVTLQVERRLAPTDDAAALYTLGLALYDARRYEEALAIFQRMEQRDNAEQHDRANALIWQGHMLDLLGQRSEAIAAYRKVAETGLDSGARDDRYGLAYEYTPYAKERMTTPFTRVENLNDK